MKPILYRPEIQDDLNEACRWYEQQRVGLGDEFLRAVEKTLDEISRNPLRVLHQGCSRRSEIHFEVVDREAWLREVEPCPTSTTFVHPVASRNDVTRV